MIPDADVPVRIRDDDVPVIIPDTDVPAIIPYPDDPSFEAEVLPVVSDMFPRSETDILAVETDVAPAILEFGSIPTKAVQADILATKNATGATSLLFLYLFCYVNDYLLAFFSSGYSFCFLPDLPLY